MRRILAGLLAIVVLTTVALGYVIVGWDRMEQSCAAYPPPPQAQNSDEVSFSFTSDGFTCTYGNGHTESSWWF